MRGPSWSVSRATNTPVTHARSRWIDRKDYQVRKVDFYDRRGDLLKTLEQKNWKYYDGKYWRAHLLRMRNHQTGKSTDLVFGGFKFQSGLGERDFVKNYLKRLR